MSNTRLTGRIIRIISNQYQVLLQDNRTIDAIAMGKVRLDKAPLVGDYVEIEQFDEIYGIQKIKERHNQLKRPPIANIDQALVVMSTVRPYFSSQACDRLLFQIMLLNIKPILIFTKMDLVEADDDIYSVINDYRHSGYQVFLVTKENDVEPIKEILAHKISVLVGNSGVGKSTLLNRLDADLAIRTQEVSKVLNRGKHTTTNTTLYPIAKGYLADTPGFSSLTFDHVSKLALATCVEEFKPYLNCKFRNCLHQSEPACGVKEAVKQGKISLIRYENYCKVLPECKED